MTLSTLSIAEPETTDLPRNDGEECALLKEVRLQLPLRVHVQLHRLKLMRGQAIRDSVIAAMAAYFASHPVGESGAAGTASV